MLKQIATIAAFALFTLSFYFAPNASAQTPSLAYETNLIQNGDAESDFGADDATSTVKPTEWITSGAFSAVKYGAKGEFPDASTPGSTGGELNFFAGGNAPVSTATQRISLAKFADDIDAGRVHYRLAGKLGGWGSLEDSAKVSVSFEDASNKVLDTGTIGPVGAGQRLLNTAFVFQEQSGNVPAGARSSLVTIVFTRKGDGYNHGFADQLSLSLTHV